MCLCCLRALRGLWGFCTRVELGGFRACCVFALVFILLPFVFVSLLCFLSLCLCVCSPLLVLLPCLVCPCGFCRCFLFPCGIYAKKKGRKGLCLASSLVLLWVALSCCCFVFLELGRTQAVNIVTKFYIKIFAACAAYCFALACVPTCVVVNLSFCSFHICCF